MSATQPTLSVQIDFTTDLGASRAYAEQLLGSGPYIYHRLQETAGTSAADSSGNGFTGTLVGTYTLNQTTSKPVSGETASRYVLLGGGGGGTAPGRVNFTAPTVPHDRFTVMAWVRQDTLDGVAGTSYIVLENDGSTAQDSLLELKVQGDGKIKLTAGNVSTVTNAAQIVAATFAHVAVTMDGPNQTGAVYVNGVAVASTTTVTSGGAFVLPPTTLTTWRWGTDQNTASISPIDRLAEPAFWVRELSTNEIDGINDAAATAPFAGYTWTDVTPYVFAKGTMTRSFGCASQFDEAQPLQFSYLLNNNDRRFEIENTASPYYPNVVPGRPTRIRLTQDGTTYDWAFGFIEDFPQAWDDAGRFCTVPITAFCTLAKLNGTQMGSRNLVEQLAGARVDTMLNAARVLAADRAIDTGANTIMEQTVESGSFGDHLRQVARTERGLFFFDPAGKATLHDQNHRTTASRSTTSQGRLGPGGIPYRSPQFHAPKSLIRNDFSLRRPGGVDQVAVDAASWDRFGQSSYTDEILLTTDALVATRADALLAAYKDPTMRIREVTFNPGQGPGYWSHALGVKLSDRYTWEFNPASGAAITRAVFVEGVSDVWRAGEYLSTWFLSVA